MDNNQINILEGCIDDFKRSNNLDLTEAQLFDSFSIFQLMKKSDLSFENISNSITDGGNDGGIDSIICLLNNEAIDDIEQIEASSISQRSRLHFVITQCKKEKTFKETAFDKIISTIPVLFDLEKDNDELLKRFNPDVVERALLMKDLWKAGAVKGAGISLEIIYCCIATDYEISSSFIEKQKQLNQLCRQTFSIENVDVSLKNCSDLIRLYQTHRDYRLTLSFKETPVSTSYQGKEALGYVGMVKLKDYKHFITDDSGNIREELFESNIRHWQGERDVNKKIRDTLENLNDRDFWWLNNGITMVAEAPNQVGKDLTLENVQIVNGLQTSYSIHKSWPGKEDDVRSVLVKVIINSDKEIVDNIIESTNFQNAVLPGDLRASDPLLRNIEQYFLTKEYYFDRRKNYYKNQGKPMGRIFSILSMAQALKAILGGEPDSARAKPTALVKSDASYKRLFKAEDDFNGYLNCCLIVAKTHDRILALTDREEKSQFSNFKLHLAMTIASEMVKKVEITNSDIATLCLNEVDFSEIFRQALEILKKAIEEYSGQNNSNIITMAKSAEFTTFLKEKIKDSLSQPK